MNRTLRCIVIAASSDPNLRFDIFERLNTGGMSLTDQELRNSIYRGPFNDLLDELATSGAWLALVNRDRPDNRLAHHEMILRFFAMLSGLPRYRPPLKAWLSDYMKDHRGADATELETHRRMFHTAIRNVGVVSAESGAPVFRRARAIRDDGTIQWDATINRPIFDLEMLGFLEAEPELLKARAGEIMTALAQLSAADERFVDTLSRATADKTRTRTRFAKWAEALTRIGIPTTLAQRLPAEEERESR
jgi:hypothetical protein